MRHENNMRRCEFLCICYSSSASALVQILEEEANKNKEQELEEYEEGNGMSEYCEQLRECMYYTT